MSTYEMHAEHSLEHLHDARKLLFQNERGPTDHDIRLAEVWISMAQVLATLAQAEATSVHARNSAMRSSR